MKKILLLLSLVLILAGCASKRFVKKGLLLENSGLYADAAEQYYNSLLKNINNIDAKLALQRTGQLVLEDKIENFKNQYQSSTAKDAVYAYRDADAYFKKLQKVGIKLLFPEEQTSYYKEVEDKYLNQIYSEASKALGLDQFSTSEKQFAEILTINPNYKDAKSKWTIAKYEPQYRKGNELMTNNMYRSAYFIFKKIIDETNTYENSLELMNTSLSQAKVTIYISPVNTNYSSYRTIAGQLNSHIVKGINSIKSPLYEVVGTGTTASSNANPFSKAFKYDRTKGVVNSLPKHNAKTVFSSYINKYYTNKGRLFKSEKHAYLKRTEEYIEKETRLRKTRVVYDKVKYYEYRLERKVRLNVGYEMKRTDRNELAVSNGFNKETIDAIHYAEFEGDYKNLVPGTWKYIDKDTEEDKIYDNSTAINRLRKVFEGRKTAKSVSELESTLMSACVSQIVKDIKNYQPEN